MTTSGETKKVVKLSQRKGEQGNDGERLGELLRRVRSIAQSRVNGLISSFFENIDDALFDLAEKAESNTAQTQFFDGMREIRKKRPLVERLFQERIGKNFAEFATGELKAVEPVQMPQGSGALSLVDDQELEESLAISSMVAKAESRLMRPLYQVNQRLAVIVGGNKVEDHGNPVGPAMLCEGFRNAAREFDLNLQVKLIVYKLFDRYVMAGLSALYDEINVELIRAGVLPQIRHEIPQGKRNPAGHASSASAPGRYDNRHDDDHAGGPVDGSLQSEIYETLRSLLAGRHTAHGHYSGPGREGRSERRSGDAALDAATLLSALSILQNQTAQTELPASDQTPTTDNTDAVQHIKRELLEQVQRLSSDKRDRHVSSADEDTIDLVGMLFEFILRDRNLPSSIQALLGRLQIPYLKVAIVDRHLFAQKSHPARRLLDALAEAGMGWSQESDRDGRLANRIQQSVETILQNFDEDLDVFDQQLTEFNRFMDDHRRRADHAEHRVAAATRGREKLNEARRITAREVLHRIGNRKLPPVAHKILSRPWANFMVLTLLRKGEESAEWKNALRFADEFIWSMTPKQTDTDRERLKLLIPQLEAALRHGLATVAYHENDIDREIDELKRFHARLFEGETPELKTAREVIGTTDALKVALRPPYATADGEADFARTAEHAKVALPEPGPPSPQSPVEEIILGSANSDAAGNGETEDVTEDDFLVAARAMKPGNWFEFVAEDGTHDRAKLSWISPISGKYLFVNRRGLKVCDKTVYALAAELRGGSATALMDVPLFDRALDAIVARLRAGSDDSDKGGATGPRPA